MSDSGISHQKTEQRLIKGPLQSPMGPAKTVSYTQPVRLATEVSIMRCTTAPAPQKNKVITVDSLAQTMPFLEGAALLNECQDI